MKRHYQKERHHCPGARVQLGGEEPGAATQPDTVKRLLQQAAAASHKHVSEFLLEQGGAAAAGTLADGRLFLVDDARWQEFLEALERPTGERPGLEKLLSEPGLLD
jgi:uncharacterized protein (DUF1778 family)